MRTDQKSTFKNTAIGALIFTLIFGTIQAFTSGIAYAFIAAPIAGVIFWILIYLFLNSKKVKQQTSLAEEDQEGVIHSGAANHFKNAEAVGGKLYLLTDRLTFKSHGFNIQNHAFSIYLSEIEALSFYNTLGLLPNGLKILLSNGETEKFVVTDRNIWQAELEKLKKA
ncbi:hypothetical protein ACS5PU_13325 [Pedobacter sp. GSP4]|uniref:hypothetical protein n=1 Tax=Pedobacter sp. GSP4 TaxID=3453716 RepID=UPI003EEBFAC1